MPDPCNDLNLQVRTANTLDRDYAELAVGKYPNIRPTFDNIEYVHAQFL